MFFTGGALGTTMGVQAGRLYGWAGVCVLLATTSAVALGVAARNVSRQARLEATVAD